MAKDFTVTITNPERAADFEAVFGTATVCVESFIPELANLPGLGEQRVYKLDLALITSEQRARLMQHLSGKFGIGEAEVDHLLDAHGVPILASDCVVTVENPARWVY